MLDVASLEAQYERDRVLCVHSVVNSLVSAKDRRFEVAHIAEFLNRSSETVSFLEERFKSSELVEEISSWACFVQGDYPLYEKARTRYLLAAPGLSLDEINELYGSEDRVMIDRYGRMQLERSVMDARARALLIRGFTDLAVYDVARMSIVEGLARYCAGRGQKPPSELLIRLPETTRKSLEADRIKQLAVLRAAPSKGRLESYEHMLHNVKQKALENVDPSTLHPAMLERRVSVAVGQMGHHVNEMLTTVLGTQEKMLKGIRELSLDDFLSMPTFLLGDPADFPSG